MSISLMDIDIEIQNEILVNHVQQCDQMVCNVGSTFENQWMQSII